MTSSVNFLMLLFANKSLTSPVYVNIRHKLTWWSYVISQWLACYRRHQKCLNRVGSVANLTLAFSIIQYFIINEGVSLTFFFFLFWYFFFLLSCLFNDFALNFLSEIQTCMKQITHFFCLDFVFCFFCCKVIWRRGTNLFCTLYNIYMLEWYLFLAF